MTTKKDHRASGSAIAAGGATTAGAGLAAGGLPFTKPNSKGLEQRQEALAARAENPGETRVKRATTKVRANLPAAKAVHGGVGGYRTHAHQEFNEKAVNDKNYFEGKKANRQQSFMRGVNAGKIEPELKVIRHMKGLRRGGTAALVGGTGVAAYGVHRAQGKDLRDKIKKNQKRRGVLESTSGALAGAGATTAAGAYGGQKVLASQGRKWEGRAKQSYAEAGKLAPNVGSGTKQMERSGNRWIAPAVNDKLIERDTKYLAGKSTKQAERVGHLRGAGHQQAYFSSVYNKTAKTIGRGKKPALAVAGLGAAGLAGSKIKDKVKKNMSAFGIDHGVIAWHG